jgi:hypothetical protein
MAESDKILFLKLTPIHPKLMMITPKLSLISLTATLLTSSLMAGAFDITYDFTGSGDATSITGDVSGSTVTGVGYSDQVVFGSDSLQIRAVYTPATQSDTDYLTFTLTSTTPGETLDFSSLEFSLGGREGNDNDVTVSAIIQIGETGSDFSTLSDVIFMPGSVDTATYTIAGPASTDYTVYTADLSDEAYQGMESVEIRIYIFDTGGGSNAYDNIDYISFSGVTVVPEANTTVLLAGIGAFMFAFVLKRRR